MTLLYRPFGLGAIGASASMLAPAATEFIGAGRGTCSSTAADRSRLAGLEAKIARRRAIGERYRTELADLPGWFFNPIDPRGEPNHWLTVAQIDPATARADRTVLEPALAAERIECRPAWKPMHLQPVFADAPAVGGAVAEEIFGRGLCLPSGSSLTDDQQSRVIEALHRLSR